MTEHDETECIRCDDKVATDPTADGLTLTYGQEEGAVKACSNCADVVKGRDHWK